MPYPGRVKNGVIVLDGEQALPEGTQVEVHLVAPEGGEGPTWAEVFKDVIGKAEGAPSDASINHDHHLYGTPKKQPKDIR